MKFLFLLSFTSWCGCIEECLQDYLEPYILPTAIFLQILIVTLVIQNKFMHIIRGGGSMQSRFVQP